MGQPWGGLMTYYLLSGRTDWQKACLTLPVFALFCICVSIVMQTHSSSGDMMGAVFALFCICVSIVMQTHSSSGDMMGAKQSLLDQSWGSRLPRTTMQYFAWSVLPFSSFLIFEIAMEISALPMIRHRSSYSVSEMYCQVWVVSWSPRYSSR